jgi:hypothetical protein
VKTPASAKEMIRRVGLRQAIARSGPGTEIPRMNQRMPTGSL